MGQAQVQAAKEVAPAPVSVMHGTLQKHAYELRQIAAISYENFLKTIQDLNEITHKFSDINGKKLVFQLKKDTDITFMWKGTVRIKCHKVNSLSGNIETSRLVNLKQYIHLYNEISHQASLLEQTVPGVHQQCNLDASIIFTELDQHLSTGCVDTEEDECCICMDRKAQVILTCSHTYCEQCIDEWNVDHKTCPICRAKVNAKQDTWVLTEKPDTSEMVLETSEYLMELTDRTGYEAVSPNNGT